jgi:hypothetical protein
MNYRYAEMVHHILLLHWAVSVQCKVNALMDHSNPGTVGSNHAQGMDAHSHVLFPSVYVESLRWADSRSKQFYGMCE